jgi:hypothetical protein
MGQKAQVSDLYNRQTIFWELGGHARGEVTLNYERLFKGPFKNTLWTLRTGFGIMPPVSERNIPPVYSVPAVATFLWGRKHMVNLSVGWTASWSKPAIDSSVLPHVIFQKFESAYIVTLGYRFMKYDNVMFLVGPTFLMTNNPNKFQWSYDFTVGYAF